MTASYEATRISSKVHILNRQVSKCASYTHHLMLKSLSLGQFVSTIVIGTATPKWYYNYYHIYTGVTHYPHNPLFYHYQTYKIYKYEIGASQR
jgi:hypothetical protein